MTTDKLKKSLQGLRKKNLIVNLSGSRQDARFVTVKGYAITDETMRNAYKWYKERDEIRFTRAPDTPAEIIEEVPISHSEVPISHLQVPISHFDTPSEQGFCPTYPVKKPEEGTQLFTQASHPSGAPQKDQEMNRFEDEWLESKDPEDDFMAPKKSERHKRVAPSTRLLELFWDHWVVVREKRRNLASPWSAKSAFQTNLKALLKLHTEEEIAEMIEVFFRMVDAGQVALRSPELWKDFWNNRAKAEQIIRQKTESTKTVDTKDQLEKFRRRVNQ
jgi:hypothetical protein